MDMGVILDDVSRQRMQLHIPYFPVNLLSLGSVWSWLGIRSLGFDLAGY